jgi:hypothetical protein
MVSITQHNGSAVSEMHVYLLYLTAQRLPCRAYDSFAAKCRAVSSQHYKQMGLSALPSIRLRSATHMLPSIEPAFAAQASRITKSSKEKDYETDSYTICSELY